MSSIYIKAAAFLYRGTRSDDLHHSIPLLVFHRGLFDCMAPRIERILPERHLYQEIAPRACNVASNACTYHLTREAWFVINSEHDIHITIATVRKLTQVASLTLSFDLDGNFNVNDVSAELKRFSVTLTKLDVHHYGAHGRSGALMHEIATAIAELHNLTELKITTLTPELCRAIAVGPGARLRELTLHRVYCDTAVKDVLVAGCPNVLTLSLDACDFSIVLAASKLQYLQSLRAWVNDSPSEADMRTAFGNMECLTKLIVRFGFSNLTEEFSNAMATIIATTVGPRLVEFTLNSRVFSSDALATLCCASSFPQLEVLSLLSSQKSIIEHDVTVSLSPSISKLTLNCFEMAPRTLTQLLTDKSKLNDIQLHQNEFSRRRGRNDEDKTAQTAASEEDDWFGQLVKCPIRKMFIDGKSLPASMDTRIALLAPTLVDFVVDIDDWPNAARDEFFGVLFSRCVHLEYFSAMTGSIAWFRDPTANAKLAEVKVAFAGLRKNESLRYLDIDCTISSPSALVEELLAMRSMDLQHLRLPKTELSLEQCRALAERFVHLELVTVSAGQRDEDDGQDRRDLIESFPHVQWTFQRSRHYQ